MRRQNGVKPRTIKHKHNNHNTTNGRSSTPDNSYCSPSKNFSWISAALVTIIAWALYKDQLSAQYNPADYMYQVKASHILKNYCHLVDGLIQFMNDTEQAHLNNPIVLLLKNKMKPIQNRISSLKVQTQQYEKMERIPGGPQHFISTAISELEEIRDVQLSQLDSEVAKIVGGVRKNIDTFLKTDTLIRDLFIQHEPTITCLHHEGINFRDWHVCEKSLQFVENVTPSPLATLIHFRKQLEVLADKFATREGMVLVLLDQLKKNGVTLKLTGGNDERNPDKVSETSVNDPAFLQGLMKIWEMWQDNDEDRNQAFGNGMEEYFLESVVPLMEDIAEEVASSQDMFDEVGCLMSAGIQRAEYFAEKHNAAQPDKLYMEIKSFIEKDIKNLRGRVENLQYQYYKVNY